LTNKFAVSQAADWSAYGRLMFKNHGNTTLYLYANPRPDPVEYWQCTTSVMYSNSHLEWLCTRVDWSTSRPARDLTYRELVCRRSFRLTLILGFRST